ncbi:MAG: Smr/MutS family protein [Prevotellaceae bacterium]|jgi:DNA mismatch repair protein MutS2|nr:Smr/MutS family protein [Prevotellaceae bacterium]
MIFPQNFENKIGFDVIRNSLKALCFNERGCEEIDKIGFSADFETVVFRQNLADEMSKIIAEFGAGFPLATLENITKSFENTRIEGTFLSVNDVANIKKTLENIVAVVKFFLSKEKTRFPELAKMSENIPLFPEILREIGKILDKDFQIKDSASEDLAKIRKEKFRVQSSVSKTMQRIINQAKSNSIVEADALPTIREGRLVIPVVAAKKRQISGIIHDESATGKTAYVEPAEVVQLNNQIRELENDERREIVKILTNFTNFIRPYYADIEQSTQYLAEIDALGAIAKYSISISAIRPYLKNFPTIDFHDARHPILQKSLEKQGKKIVPLSVSLSKINRITIISGPNAGGKSVCLKTVGLLQYMLQCGLPVPFGEHSEAGIFADIFIDIGDGQNLESDLSTYSAHLQNMKFFLRNSTSKSLLLIDEFGAGTEPQIGGAIAEATLQQFCKNEVFALISTHYTNLKHFASNTAGVLNGAMLYDKSKMQPLFVLQTGAPGSSFAIEIAKNIGLPQSVIENAEQLIGSEQLNYDKNFQSALRDKRYWENKRREIRQKEKDFEQKIAEYDKKIAEISSQKKEIISNAKSEAKTIIENSNALIENTIRTIKESNAEKETTKIARENISKFSQKIVPEKKSEKPKEHNFSVGDFVVIRSQNVVGQLVEINGGNAFALFGSIRTKVKIENLEYVSKNQAKKNVQARLSKNVMNEIRAKQLDFSQQIDLRGMRADEALQAVMYFIDDAQVANVQRVRILHGTGNGILRQIIREYLSTCKGIRSFADEQVQFGGAGITVVEF